MLLFPPQEDESTPDTDQVRLQAPGVLRYFHCSALPLSLSFPPSLPPTLYPSLCLSLVARVPISLIIAAPSCRVHSSI